MKSFSAQYVFTNSGPPLKKGIVTVADDGTVISVVDTGGKLDEHESLEFHNGIIIPGFVNCHCHLELSHMKDLIPQGTGLPGFLKNFQMKRAEGSESIRAAVSRADDELFREGVVLCADICNTRLTFDIKKKSRIKYINLIEVFGIDPIKAQRRLDEILDLYHISCDYGIPSWIVPHASYSLSVTLFRLLRQVTASNNITSLHFMETLSETDLLRSQSGSLMQSYLESEYGISRFEPVSDHVSAVLDEVTSSGNLILVHNTFADSETIRKIKTRKNLFWCLCPNANIYIENQMPPVESFVREDCTITTGTDSMASNGKLSVLDELKTIQMHFPQTELIDLIKWATLNGASALCETRLYGSIEPGKKPGLLLISDLDLGNMHLLPGSRVSRLI